MLSIQSNQTIDQVFFLIEGHTSNSKNSAKFPEVTAAIEIAKVNKGLIFDSISSFNDEHIAQAFQKCQNECQSKTLALSIFLAFANEGSAEEIISLLLKKPYQHMVDKEKCGEMPNWLQNLNAFTIEAFAKSVLDEFYVGDMAKFKLVNSQLQKDLTELSNHLSAHKTLEVLDKSSADTVYGLIGAAHLSMLDNLGKVIVSDASRIPSYFT